MRKIVWSIVTTGTLFFATQNMQAQDEEMEEIDTEVEMEVEQEEFVSVKVSELPQAVKDAIITAYNDAVASEAWMKMKDEKKIYKIKLDINGEMKKVYIDEDGNWLEKDDEHEE